jgi:hypothetical protein
MAIEQLQLKIGADVSGVTAAMKVLNNQLARLQKLASMPGLSFNQLERLQGMIHKTAGGIAKLNAVSSFTSTPLNKLTKGSNEATQSLINLSRVAQDAPYGFIGIANNINPLFESFERLVAANKGVGGAFKALAGSLLSSGGIGLAIGIVSSLLVKFGDQLFSSGNAAKEQANKLKEAREALNDYVDSLNDVDQARVKGLQSAQQELVHLKTLYSATQNANIPLADRKKIVDELQEQYPKYFGNIKDEIILAGGAEKAYKSLTAAIIANAKSRAAEKQIEDLASQGIAVDEKRAKNSTTQIKQQQELVRIQQQLNAYKEKGLAIESATGEVIATPKAFTQQGVPEKITALAIKAAKAQQQLNGVVKDGNDLLKQKNDLTARQEQLTKFVQVTVEKTPDALTDPTGGDKQAKKVKDNTKELEKAIQERKDILTEFQKDFEVLKLPVPELSMPLEKFSIEGLVKELSDKLNKALETHAPIKIKIPVEPIIGIDIKNIKDLKIELKPTITWQGTELNDKLEEFGKIGNQIGERLGHGFGDVFQDIFETSMTNAVKKGLSGEALEEFKNGLVAVAAITSEAFNGLGDAFGNMTSALLRGENAIQAFGESLKNSFIQLAAQLAKTIVLAGILSAITGGASGGGLSFLGAFKKILGFNKGGTVPGGQGTSDTVPAMLTPGEEVLTVKEAPIWRMFKKMLAIGTIPKMPKISNGVFHFNTGGTVPNVRTDSRALNRISNQINVEPTVFPTYLPAFSMTHDQFRMWYRRAETYGNNFGR